MINKMTSLRRLITLGAITALYLVSARLGLLLAFEHTNISPVWPPTGVALAAVLFFGFEVWPAITIGAFLANYTTGLPVLTSGFISIGNTLEAVVGFFLVRYFTDARNPFGTTSDTFRFLLASAFSTTVSATVGTSAIYFGELHPNAPFTYLWWIWWLGDTVGAVTIAPLILVWRSYKSFSLDSKRLWEALPVFILLTAIGIFVFSGLFRIGAPLVYTTVPVVVLVAYKFQQRGATAALFLLSFIAIVGTVRGHGPFAGENLQESLLILQSFVGVIACTALSVAAIVTERKRVEEINRSQLKEKEVLLQEIHHRVKNNLQIISSLLDMQLNHSDPVVRALLTESRNRIHSMAMIHEKLYESDNLGHINLAYYLKDLVTHIFHTYQIGNQKIEIRLDCHDTFVGLEKAVPVGLIVNEIITNSLLHAFTSDQSGEVALQLRCPDGRIVLEISDNGNGMPAKVDLEQSRTMGLKLISILTKQLHASLQLDRSSGTRFVIEFQ